MTNSNNFAMFMFPGQGSQYKGMGSDLYEEYPAARAVYDRASSALGYDMAELSFLDPKEALGQTQFTQPALLTHSIACLEVFKELTGNKLQPRIVGGHSLGEYTALVAANALTLEGGLTLVKNRGELMAQYGEGEMIAFRLAVDTLRPFADRYYCGVGGCNLPEQTVAGGTKEDLDRLAAALKKEDRRNRGTRLKTAGAFHTYLMIEAARHFRPLLEETPMESPDVQVMANYTGGFHDSDPDSIKSRLFFQLFHPVKWIWGLQRALEQPIDTIVEFGGGIGAGETPADKRPNLSGITSKTLETNEHQATYLPVINKQSLVNSAAAINSAVTA